MSRNSSEQDLVGRRFGRLEVLQQNGNSRFLCRCDCGKELSVSESDLNRGHKKSCGCLRKRQRGNDISGMRSGRLVAVEATDQMRRGARLWKCRCDCGRETLVEGYRIQSGRVSSCGCSRVGNRSKDLTNMRFGELTALERLNEKDGSCYLWLCRCDCGQEIRVAADRLLSGKTKSCGHLRDPRLHLHYTEGTCVELIDSPALRSNNTSGHTGVVWTKGKWRATITFKKTTHYLGEYSQIEDAVRARKQAEHVFYGEFLEAQNSLHAKD